MHDPYRLYPDTPTGAQARVLRLSDYQPAAVDHRAAGTALERRCALHVVGPDEQPTEPVDAPPMVAFAHRRPTALSRAFVGVMAALVALDRTGGQHGHAQ